MSRLAPPRGGINHARLRRAAQRGWFLALLLAVFGGYGFMVSAGVKTWPVYGVYHDLQADGFLAGKLSLPLAPDPHLLKAKDPYDAVNIDYWALDASYYKGKYYLYWGPVPALIQAAAKWALGVHGTVGDQYLALFFHCLAFWAGALIIERLLVRVFGSHSRWLVVLGALVFALANPTPHAATTASTYHTAIMSAQSFLMLGLLFAFDAVWHAGGTQARSWRLLAAGAAWGLAMASRVTVIPALALMVVITVGAEAWPAAHRLRRSFWGALALGAPLVATGLALLLYNKLRFDDWLEFGSNLQLSGMPRFRISSIYLAPNLYSYLFRPWQTSCAFPYFYQVWDMGRDAFPAKFVLPSDYQVIEPVIGWVLAVPFAWLTPLALLLAPWRAANGRRDRVYLFCLLSFGVVAAVTGVVGLGLYATTMRYLSDVTFGLVLVALMGAYALKFHPIGTALPRLVSAALVALATVTVLLGLLIGYQGYNAHFHRFNPRLDRTLVNALSVCGERLPPPPSWMN